MIKKKFQSCFKPHFLHILVGLKMNETFNVDVADKKYLKNITLSDSFLNFFKVKKILKGSLDSISSSSPSVKIQILGGKVCSRHKSKTLLGIINTLFVFKSLSSNVLPLHLSFSPIIVIFTEGDGIDSKLSS